MECNMEEALRASQLAESKFKAQDQQGAMRLALKAQALCPSLPNLAQTITAYQLHIAANTRKLPSGSIDWHAVLGVGPAADHETIKKQFKKLCMLTHPDKNSSAAADGAFKIVTRAFNCVSSSSSTCSSSSEKDWEYLYAKIRCDECGLLHHWDFSRKDNKFLYHYCKFCSNWCEVGTVPAKSGVPLSCQDCYSKLRWGSYRPIGFECSLCDGYSIVGVNPNWVPTSQTKGCESPFMPGTVSCTYCGAWNKYKADDENHKLFVSCKRCGLRSIVQLEFY